MVDRLLHYYVCVTLQPYTLTISIHVMRETTPPSVLTKQVDLLYQRLPSSLVTSATIVLCLLFFLKDFPEPITLYIWVGLMLLLFGLRTLTIIYYHKIKKQDSFRIEQAEAIFVIGVIATGIGWGSLAWWLYPLTSDESTHILLFVVITGLAAAAIPSLSYRRFPIQIFTCLTVLPMIIGLYRTPGSQQITLGIIAIVYTVFICKSGLIFQKHHEQILLLKEKALAREAKLKIARKKAEASNQEKSRFLANMSHEIRTPINSIIGHTRLALREDIDHKQQLHLNIIQNSSKNLLALINDILDFSKIEAGEFNIDNKPFDLHETIQTTISTVQVLAQKKGLEMQYTIAPDIPKSVTGDNLRLSQILLNLLNNSIKFTQKGFIELNIQRLQTTDDSLTLQFTVRDTGIGIALNKQKYIFKEFAQEDDSTTRKFGGSGLGLAICRQLCHLMGGTIKVGSTPAKGSTFTVSIPFLQCTLKDLPAKTHPTTTTPTQIRPLSLLLVEDNEANRILTRMVLEQDKHHLVEAHDGLQALNILAEQTFDAVLMDVQMPIMDGFTATQIIRSAEQNEQITKVDEKLAAKLKNFLQGTHTPIIAMTANAMSGDREKCLDAGMDDYLAKPFHPDGLAIIFDRLGINQLPPKQASG